MRVSRAGRARRPQDLQQGGALRRTRVVGVSRTEFPKVTPLNRGGMGKYLVLPIGGISFVEFKFELVLVATRVRRTLRTVVFTRSVNQNAAPVVQ